MKEEKSLSGLGRFLFSLVPKDTKTQLTENGYRFFSKNKSWNFDKLKEYLTSVEGITQDSSYKPWKDFNDECYFTYKSDNTIILFEINHGVLKKNIDCPLITISFRKSGPSIEEFMKLIEIIKQFKKINSFDFEIFSFIHEDFISLEKLIEMKKMIR